MRSRTLAGLEGVAAAALFGTASAQTETTVVREPTYTTVSGGWMWPADGPVTDAYTSGFTLAGSFRTAVSPNFLTGFEVGYAWLPLDTSKLGAENSGSTISGSDLGMLSITTENDYIMGYPSSTMRPFINTGLGFFRSYGANDVVATTNGTSSKVDTGVYSGSFFGFHVGVGVLIKKERFGIRLDASYQYLCQSGDDLGFFPLRAGVIFYP